MSSSPKALRGLRFILTAVLPVLLLVVSSQTHAGVKARADVLLEPLLKTLATPAEEKLLIKFTKSLDATCRSFCTKRSQGTPPVCRPGYDRKGLRSATLREACLFPELYKAYSEALAKVPDYEKSGIQIPEALRKLYPTVTLQSGAWMVVPFIDSTETGVDLAQRILLLRVGLEKALSAWLTYLRDDARSPGHQFTLFVLPRYIASFSGYSTTLRLLRFEKAMTCQDAQPTFACEELRAEVKNLSASILANLRANKPLRFLDGLNQDNSTERILRTNSVKAVLRTLERVRQESDAEKIAEAFDPSNPLPSMPIVDFQEAFTNLMMGPSPLSPLDSEEYMQLLTSVSILSEMVYLEAWAGGNTDGQAAALRPELQKYFMESATEVEGLMSLVLKALRNEEEPRL